MSPFLRMVVDFLAVVGAGTICSGLFIAWVLWRDERWWRRMRGER